MVINKKAQMKIQQMAFMLMAIILFFVLAGMIGLIIYVSNLQDSALALQEENAMLLVSKLANSPEFSCEKAFGSSQTNCVDADKVMMLRENIENYDNFWGVSNIQIRKAGGNSVCSLGTYPNCEIINLFSGNVSSEYSNFVALCWKESTEYGIENKCEIAKLMVAYNG
ncbi:MAG: hypothetical protein OQK82_05450 [Candidatus Pacearchaeota archaeon]|nr:hypothetical protein [Candidatus Pacearchaeota archaeon]